MSTKQGNLLWRRMRLTLGTGATAVDTGLRQQNQNFEAGDPPLAGSATVASRVMVIPLAPTDAWSGITHAEPVLDATTKTVHVTFTNPGEGPVTVNCLFWDPHSEVGPGQADTYVQPPG
jgi:hypothetical protein